MALAPVWESAERKWREHPRGAFVYGARFLRAGTEQEASG
jgi:hypothetical protein